MEDLHIPDTNTGRIAMAAMAVSREWDNMRVEVASGTLMAKSHEDEGS